MKNTIRGAFLALALPAITWAGDLGNLRQWIAAQPIKAGTAIDMRGEVRGVSYLSLASLGQGGYGLETSGASEYFSINAGVDFGTSDAKFMALPMCKPHNIGDAIWRKLPGAITSRVRRLLLPDIELGIGVNLPRPNEAWVLGNEIRGVAAFKL